MPVVETRNYLHQNQQSQEQNMVLIHVSISLIHRSQGDVRFVQFKLASVRHVGHWAVFSAVFVSVSRCWEPQLMAAATLGLRRKQKKKNGTKFRQQFPIFNPNRNDVSQSSYVPLMWQLPQLSAHGFTVKMKRSVFYRVSSPTLTSVLAACQSREKY